MLFFQASSTTLIALSTIITASLAQSTYYPVNCYYDTTNYRTLDGPSTSSSSMTVEACNEFCASQGSFKFFGLEYSSECYCGDGLRLGLASESGTTCDMTCSGDSSETCGGGDAVSVYTTDIQYSSQVPVTSSTLVSLGCFEDFYPDYRVLSGATAYSQLMPIMTVELCGQTCQSQGFDLSGVENGDECYCGSSVPTVTSDSCSSPCAGDSSEICGGPNAINVYYIPHVPSNVELFSVGCYFDETNYRSLDGPSTSSSDMTVEMCYEFCGFQGTYTFFGLEYSSECYCGNGLRLGTAAASGTTCNMACSGDSSETCGGGNALSVYSTQPAQSNAASAATPTLNSLGCFADFYPNSRNLDGATAYSQTMSSMTVELCGSICFQQGFEYSGVENGDECYCGNSFQAVSSNACSTPCAGDSSEICGGSNALNIYQIENNGGKTPVVAATTSASTSTTTTSAASTTTTTVASFSTTSDSTATTPADSTSTPSSTTTTASAADTTTAAGFTTTTFSSAATIPGDFTMTSSSATSASSTSTPLTTTSTSASSSSSTTSTSSVSSSSSSATSTSTTSSSFTSTFSTISSSSTVSPSTTSTSTSATASSTEVSTSASISTSTIVSSTTTGTTMTTLTTSSSTSTAVTSTVTGA